MKLKHILIAIPFILITACSNTNSKSKGDIEVEVKLENTNGESIYLEKLTVKGIIPIDTAIIDSKGEFTFSPTVGTAGFFRIRISNENFATLIFEKGQKITITGDYKNIGEALMIKGSPDSEIFLEMSSVTTLFNRKRDTLQQDFKAFATLHQGETELINAKAKELDVPFAKLQTDHQAYINKFVSDNPSSLAALAAIQQLAIEQYIQTYIKLDKVLFEKYPTVDYVTAFHQDVKTKTACAIGTAPPEINYNTPEGIPLALSSLKGKVVLIDFWASWCGPCRKENPNLVRAYNKYKDQGFDIYSVSLDNNMGRWKAAIVADHLTWKSHVCDFKGWKSPVVRDFNFNGIPSSYLLDRDGNIIAKNLRGAALDQKLSEIFN